MNYLQLGSSGLKVSRIALGMMSYGDPQERKWFLGEEVAVPIVRRAAEAGINFFDTADMYSLGMSEEITGRVLAKFFRAAGRLRARHEGLLRNGIRPERSRSVAQTHNGFHRRIPEPAGHRSCRSLPDPPVGLRDTHRGDHGCTERRRAGGQGTLHRCIQHVRVATSKGPVRRANRWRGEVHFDAEPLQPRVQRRGTGDDPAVPRSGCWCHPLEPTGERASRRNLAACRREEHGARRHRPVAHDMYEDADFDVVDAVRAVADERGLPPAQIALAWLLAKPGVSAPIMGATKLQHLEDAIAAEQVTLTEDEIELLEAPYRPHAILGHS